MIRISAVEFVKYAGFPDELYISSSILLGTFTELVLGCFGLPLYWSSEYCMNCCRYGSAVV